MQYCVPKGRGGGGDTSGNVAIFTTALSIGHVSYKALLKFDPTHGIYRLDGETDTIDS